MRTITIISSLLIIAAALIVYKNVHKNDSSMMKSRETTENVIRYIETDDGNTTISDTSN